MIEIGIKHGIFRDKMINKRERIKIMTVAAIVSHKMINKQIRLQDKQLLLMSSHN
jgi:hypothetical protein